MKLLLYGTLFPYKTEEVVNYDVHSRNDHQPAWFKMNTSCFDMFTSKAETVFLAFSSLVCDYLLNHSKYRERV